MENGDNVHTAATICSGLENLAIGTSANPDEDYEEEDFHLYLSDSDDEVAVDKSGKKIDNLATFTQIFLCKQTTWYSPARVNFYGTSQFWKKLDGRGKEKNRSELFR